MDDYGWHSEDQDANKNASGKGQALEVSDGKKKDSIEKWTRGHALFWQIICLCLFIS